MTKHDTKHDSLEELAETAIKRTSDKDWSFIVKCLFLAFFCGVLIVCFGIFWGIIIFSGEASSHFINYLSSLWVKD